MLQAKKGESMQTIKDRLRDEFAVVGLLEELPTTLALTRAHLGLPTVAITRRRQNMHRKSVEETLSRYPGLEEAIRKHNARDFEIYEYVRDVLLPAQMECFGADALQTELALIAQQQAKADSEPPVEVPSFISG